MRLPSRLQIMLLCGALNAAGELAIGGYVWLAMLQIGLPEVVGWYATRAFLLAGLVGTIVTWYLLAPYVRVLEALDRGTPSNQLSRRDVLQTLRLPQRLFALTMWLWLLPSLVFPLLTHTIWDNDPQANVHVVVAGMTASFVVGVSVYYALLRLMRRVIAPVLLDTGSVSHLEPFQHTRVWTHLALLIALLGLVAPASVATLAWAGHATPALISYVSIDYLVVGLFVGWEVMSGVSLGIGHLQERMDRVVEGDLQARGEVRALDSIGVLTSHFNDMVAGLRQREAIRETFGRYVSGQVASAILEGQVHLGGEERHVTVLFADLRGFTRLSEAMPADRVVQLLNEHLGAMVRCVDETGGVTDKFMGDAVMAVWGVPVGLGSPEDDAFGALDCALRMSAELDRMNAQRLSRGMEALEMGIGLHSGLVVAGNIGARQRMEYTIIGDVVNVCSRIEGLTRALDRRLLLSDATAALIGPRAELVELDTLPVKGRRRPVRLFTLPD
jgi:class 3 adenylate cyclase